MVQCGHPQGGYTDKQSAYTPLSGEPPINGSSCLHRDQPSLDTADHVVKSITDCRAPPRERVGMKSCRTSIDVQSGFHNHFPDVNCLLTGREVVKKDVSGK